MTTTTTHTKLTSMKRKKKLNKGKSCKNHWHLWGFEPSGRTPPKLHVSIHSWPPPGTGRGNELVHQGLPPEEQCLLGGAHPPKSLHPPCRAWLLVRSVRCCRGGAWGGGKGAQARLTSLPLPFPPLFPEKVWMWAPRVPSMGEQCRGWASLSGRILSHPRRLRDPALAQSGPGRCTGGGVAERHTLVSDLTPGGRHGRRQCWQ